MNKEERFTVRIPKEMKKKFILKCEKKGMSGSEVARLLILKFIEKGEF